MKLATTTSDFSKYINSDVEILKELYSAGFKYVDLSLFSDKKVNAVYTDENYLFEVEKLKSTAKELGLTFVQAHLPDGSEASPIKRDDKFDLYLKTMLRSIEICGLLGIKNAVYHAGCEENITKKEWQERNLEFVKLLIPHLEKWNVNLLLENYCHVNTYGMYYANNAKDLIEFANLVNHKNFGICWDTGHANCEGSQYDEILTLGKHLKAIHYNDNKQVSDDHTIPFLGTLNHDEIINALIDANYEGYFTLECNSPVIRKGGWPFKRREFAKRDTLANPPLFLIEDLEKILFKTAKHLLESYDIYEE